MSGARLTAAQERYLRQVALRGRMYQGDGGCTSTAVVRRLEALGLVELKTRTETIYRNWELGVRSRGGSHGRSPRKALTWSATLTPAGQALIDADKGRAP